MKKNKAPLLYLALILSSLGGIFQTKAYLAIPGVIFTIMAIFGLMQLVGVALMWSWKKSGILVYTSSILVSFLMIILGIIKSPDIVSDFLIIAFQLGLLFFSIKPHAKKFT